MAHEQGFGAAGPEAKWVKDGASTNKAQQASAPGIADANAAWADDENKKPYMEGVSQHIATHPGNPEDKEFHKK